MKGGRYESNQWKIRLHYTLYAIIILFIIGGAGFFMKSKYEAYQTAKQEKVRKQGEEKKAKEEEKTILALVEQ